MESADNLSVVIEELGAETKFLQNYKVLRLIHSSGLAINYLEN